MYAEANKTEWLWINVNIQNKSTLSQYNKKREENRQRFPSLNRRFDLKQFTLSPGIVEIGFHLSKAPTPNGIDHQQKKGLRAHFVLIPCSYYHMDPNFFKIFGMLITF